MNVADPSLSTACVTPPLVAMVVAMSRCEHDVPKVTVAEEAPDLAQSMVMIVPGSTAVASDERCVTEYPTDEPPSEIVGMVLPTSPDRFRRSASSTPASAAEKDRLRSSSCVPTDTVVTDRLAIDTATVIPTATTNAKINAVWPRLARE